MSLYITLCLTKLQQMSPINTFFLIEKQNRLSRFTVKDKKCHNRRSVYRCTM